MSRLPFPPTAHERLLGCLIGGALGDAIGLFTEFLPKSEVLNIYGPNATFTLLAPDSHPLAPKAAGFKTMHMDRHRGMFPPGSWTDDTDQSLLILLAWLRAGGKVETAAEIDELAKDFARRLKVWCREGLRALARAPLGLGRTVKGSVYAIGWEEDPIGKAREQWIETGRVVAPNGAVMRTAVVGVLFYQDSSSLSGLDRTFLAALKLGGTTHGDPRCLISSAIVSGIVAAMMRDDQSLQTEADVRRVVTAALAFFDACEDFPDKLSEEQRTELAGFIWPATLLELQLDERSSIGYTFKCLGAGMWGLRKAMEWRADFDASGDKAGGVHERDIFERVITDITNEGGDADTNAVVAGALVGTFLGVRGLCYRWAVGLGEGERSTIITAQDESGVSITKTESEKIPLRRWLTRKGEAASSLLGIMPTSTSGNGSGSGSGSPLGSYSHLDDPDTLLYGYEGAQPLTDKEMDDLMWGKVMQGMVERLGYADDPKYNQPVVVSRKQWKDKVNKGECVVM